MTTDVTRPKARDRGTIRARVRYWGDRLWQSWVAAGAVDAVAADMLIVAAEAVVVDQHNSGHRPSAREPNGAAVKGDAAS